MQPTRRSPLINRGTYLRIYSIDQVMRAFLEGFPKGSRQIVNLGAGTDTRYFRFKKFHSDLLQQVKYFEIDFEETILHKISIIRKRKVLSQLLTQVRYEGTHLVSEDYCLIPGDLRDWTTVLTSLESVGYDSSLPTLFISECVFIYIQPKYVDHLIQWIGQLPCSIFVCYEQILPDDAFGSMMLKNLKVCKLSSSPVKKKKKKR
ncbi:Leucine carboxyl methyltransferase 1 [Coelomomyces lativittatus]|nr:Leucine carboxyl methyltransferase 1 [Coelomomyces lativittatus]